MKTYLEPKEIEQMEQSAEYLRDKILVRLLFRLGCRVSEALGITFSDIDFSQSTVTIVHLKRRIKLSCPNCGEHVLLNPFTIEGDWRPIAQGWRGEEA